MNLIGKIVVLNNGLEEAICKEVAKRRYRANRENGVIDRKYGKQSNEFTDFEGVAGELAGHKLLDLYPGAIFNTDCRSALIDDQGDMHPWGKKTDWKTTKYNNGQLMVTKKRRRERKPIDLYGLFTGLFPSYVFRGFMTPEELLRESRVQVINGHECYVARQFELKEFDELFAQEKIS